MGFKGLLYNALMRYRFTNEYLNVPAGRGTSRGCDNKKPWAAFKDVLPRMRKLHHPTDRSLKHMKMEDICVAFEQQVVLQPFSDDKLGIILHKLAVDIASLVTRAKADEHKKRAAGAQKLQAKVEAALASPHSSVPEDVEEEDGGDDEEEGDAPKKKKKVKRTYTVEDLPYPSTMRIDANGCVVLHEGAEPNPSINLERLLRTHGMRNQLWSFFHRHLDKIRKDWPPQIIILFDYQEGGPWLFTRDRCEQITSLRHTFGEADLQLAADLRLFGKDFNCILSSLDSDVIINALWAIDSSFRYHQKLNAVLMDRDGLLSAGAGYMDMRGIYDGLGVEEEGTSKLKRRSKLTPQERSRESVFVLTLVSMMTGSDYVPKNGLVKGIGSDFLLGWGIQAENAGATSMHEWDMRAAFSRELHAADIWEGWIANRVFFPPNAKKPPVRDGLYNTVVRFITRIRIAYGDCQEGKNPHDLKVKKGKRISSIPVVSKTAVEKLAFNLQYVMIEWGAIQRDAVKDLGIPIGSGLVH